MPELMVPLGDAHCKRTFRVALAQIKIHSVDGQAQIRIHGAEATFARCADYILKYELA